jgi:hypothetical protein
MSRLYDWLPMQLHERYFDEDAGDSESSASVRSCPNALVIMFMIFTNHRERIVVVQNRVIISNGITRIARMVQSSLSTGIKRRATIWRRVPIHHRSTESCTTSMTGRKMTFSQTRPTRNRLVLCPRLVLCLPLVLYLRLRLVRSTWLLPEPPRLPLRGGKTRLLRPVHIHRNPRRSPLRPPVCPRPTVPVPLPPKRMRPSQQRQAVLATTTTTTTTTTPTTGTLTDAPVRMKTRTSKSQLNHRSTSP